MNGKLLERWLVAIVVMAITPVILHSQGLSIAYVNGRSDSDNGLGDVKGTQLVFARAIGERPMSIRYGVSYLSGSRGAVGSLCSGLVFPGTCLVEPLSLERRLITASAGVGHFGFRDRQVMVHTYADIIVGAVRKKDVAIVSGDSRSVNKATIGIRGGIEGQWRRRANGLAALQFGVAMEGVRPIGTDQCVDCWVPFRGGFDVMRTYFGIVLGRQAAAPIGRD